MVEFKPQIIKFEKTESTNEVASKLIDDGKAEEGMIILANEQTKGKGYSTNVWSSEKNKNLTFSIVLKPSFLKPEKQFILHKISSLAVLQTLSKLVKEPEHFKIKWPNDIYYKKDKIAGILTENKIIGSKLEYSLIGIGININQETFPKEIPNPISLKLITNHNHLTDQILDDFTTIFFNKYEKIKSDQKSFDEEYLSNLFLRGEYNKYIAQGEEFKGKIIGIDEFGFLEIVTAKAEKHSFDFKEIIYVLENKKNN